MKSKLLAGVLLTPFFILILWVAFLCYQRHGGMDVTVAVTGYDPRDLLSGHYIAYQIDWDKTDCKQFPNAVCPKNDFCVEARWGRQCRFYIPEKYARRLDRLFWNRREENLTFNIVYSYHPGKKAIAKTLLINGRDWHDFVK